MSVTQCAFECAYCTAHSDYDAIDGDDDDNDYTSNSSTVSQLCADSNITIKTECIPHTFMSFLACIAKHTEKLENFHTKKID